MSLTNKTSIGNATGELTVNLPVDANGIPWTGKEEFCIKPNGKIAKIWSFELSYICNEYVWIIQTNGYGERAEKCKHSIKEDSYTNVINDIEEQAYIISQLKEFNDTDSIAYHVYNNLIDIEKRIMKLSGISEVGPKTKEAMLRAMNK